MELLAVKNWDRYVAQAELVSRTDGLQSLETESSSVPRSSLTRSSSTSARAPASPLPAAEAAARVWAVDICRCRRPRIGAWPYEDRAARHLAEPHSARHPGEFTGGIWEYLYPSRPSTLPAANGIGRKSQ